jgi:hypothetical protein
MRKLVVGCLMVATVFLPLYSRITGYRGWASAAQGLSECLRESRETAGVLRSLCEWTVVEDERCKRQCDDVAARYS